MDCDSAAGATSRCSCQAKGVVARSSALAGRSCADIRDRGGGTLDLKRLGRGSIEPMEGCRAVGVPIPHVQLSNRRADSAAMVRSCSGLTVEQHHAAFLASMADIRAGRVTPYEGARQGFQYLQSGPPEGPHYTGEDPVRVILIDLIQRWEELPQLRDRVDAEIRALADRMADPQRKAFIAEFDQRWRVFASRVFASHREEPFPGEGALDQRLDNRWVKKRPIDLRRIGAPKRIQDLYLDRAQIETLTGIERMPNLQRLDLYEIPELDVADLRRARGLQTLVVSNSKTVASYLDGLPLADLPELRTVIIQQPWREPHPTIDTTWVRSARWLDHIQLHGVVPACGSFDDFVTARLLTNLQITEVAEGDHEALCRALPLTRVDRAYPPAPRPAPSELGMFTPAGNAMVRHAIDDVIQRMATSKRRPGARTINGWLNEHLRAVLAAGHAEVGDTHVRDRIVEELEEALDAIGYDVDVLDFD
jgi:hypothetical protein